MNFFQMAWRSCVRKPVKSILLFLVVFTISLFMLSGFAAKEANIATQDKTRQAVGAGFLLTENESDRHKRINAISEQLGEKEGELEGYYQKKITVNGTPAWQSGTENSFETLQIDDIKKIAKVKGISDYNITTGITAVNPINFHRIEDEDTDQNADILGVSLIGNREMSMDANVLSGNLSIQSGRMVTAEDTDVCVISEELAAKNNFKIGTKLQFNNYQDKENATIFEAEIIGIYQIKQKMTPLMSGDTYRSENVIFTDLRFPEKAEGNIENPLFVKAYFQVGDVDLYDSVKEKMKDVDIKWERYDLIDNNGNLETMSTNFNNLESISEILIYIVAGASFIILFLVFLFWMKNRVQEVGILLSLGTAKIKILIQILTEAMLISLLAISLSFLAAPKVSKAAADYLVDQQVQEAAEKKSLESGKVAMNFEEVKLEVKDVTVKITSQMMLVDILGIGMLITISVVTAGTSILRKNPKDILSELS